MDYTLSLPGGETLPGQDPVVVIGPNGSGKTRRTREITAPVPIDFINALRNTRVAPDLPAMGMDTARNNFNSHRNRSRSQHWELTSDFDYMLSQLLAQQAMAAIEFYRLYQIDPQTATIPEITPLTRVETLWRKVFPGRELHWRDWKPLIKNHSTGAEFEYSANQMSDGERAALYLAGRVLTADTGVVVIDEPETHFHSLLAVRLWNALEEERPDIRFVYVTHDLTFALSRRNPHFVLASPTSGLRTIDVQLRLPKGISEALLGAASLSFYASRVVFCEGDSTSLDSQLYSAWFSGSDTVVRSVGSSSHVVRCVDAVANSGIATALSAVGIIDRDYHSDVYRSTVESLGVTVLAVHEVESLLCLPDVVAAVCAHVSQNFDLPAYRMSLAATVSEEGRHQIIIERWKRRIEPQLEGLVSGVSKRNTPVKQLIADLPDVFDYTKWPFSPRDLLSAEAEYVESALPDGPLDEFLAVTPGKQLLPVAAQHAGMKAASYSQLVTESLRGEVEGLKPLGQSIESALMEYLPQRRVAVRAIPANP